MLALLLSLMHRHEGTMLDLVHQRAGLDTLLSEDDVSTLMSSLMDNHKGIILEFLRERRYIHKKMSAAQVTATLLAKCNLKMRQWRNVIHCMKTYLDIDDFCAGYWQLMSLGEKGPNIYLGEYEYEKKKGEVKEHIVFWWKQPEKLLVSSVENIINGNDIKHNDIVSLSLHTEVTTVMESSGI
jgi:hypothetical protein